ncbi:hypothetical protein FACS1894170_02910 [Planctomycetales bacterium]|nr:hypothetical protein FACS1894170_02910 [Planctomycetales bacterium]
MDTKWTRRAVLGTVIGGLAVAPFVITSLRKPKQLPINVVGQKYGYFLERVSFPRTYEPQFNPLLPPEKREKVLSVHKRYWQNYAKIDEVEFDYSSRTILDGKLEPNVWSMDAHIRMKYGYGMEANGTDVEGRPIHYVFNMGGNVTPVEGGSDLSSLMISFFGSYIARPEFLTNYFDVREESTLPENPSISGNEIYNAVHLFAEGKIDYYSQKTGMLVMHYCPKWKNEGVACQCLEYIPVSGVFIPTKHESYFDDNKSVIREQYSNIKVKLIS